ncbi:hypothetical protein [Paraburkholderia tuberum]|uniref:hypothetical protein n=1 Tax=Paraburkholderia tuberum TaxID=157910 RepID=UPI00115FDA2F|nr:hypothetical protein [Paraburkholderia tuberum]
MKMNSRGYAPAFLYFGLLGEFIDREEHEAHQVQHAKKPAAEARNFAELFFYITVFKWLMDLVPWRRIALLLRF